MTRQERIWAFLGVAATLLGAPLFSYWLEHNLWNRPDAPVQQEPGRFEGGLSERLQENSQISEQEEGGDAGSTLSRGGEPLIAKVEGTSIGPSSSKPATLLLTQGKPLQVPSPVVTLSVTFSDELGGLASLYVYPEGGSTIVESLLGPGGEISFHTSSGEFLLSVVDWDFAAKTLSLVIRKKH